jgi:hypothetical protein
METTKKKWLVHSYNNQSKFVTHAKARRLLAKHGGSYDWLENVCHVYLLPVTTTTFEHRGQEELNPWIKAK